MTAINQPSLEDVLDMLLVAYDAPTPDAVAEFAERYPAYRADLITFAADWAEQAHLPAPEPLSDDQEARVFSRAQSFLQNMLFEQASAPVATFTPRASLYDLAKSAGVSLRDVANAAGLDVPLISKLNRRAIRASTIRPHIARAVAQFLRVDITRVIESWIGPPIVGGASFLASDKPMIPEQEDFDVAVSNSTLTPEQKAAALHDDL